MDPASQHPDAKPVIQFGPMKATLMTTAAASAPSNNNAATNTTTPVLPASTTTTTAASTNTNNTPNTPNTPSPPPLGSRPFVITTSPASVSNSVANAKRSPDRDDTQHAHDGEPKRRRVMRACDVCRRRKIRCDGPTSTTGARVGGDTKCTHCRENRLACTYVNEPSRKATRPGLVTALKERCQRFELLIQQLEPGLDIVEFVGPPIDCDTFDEDAHRDALRARRIPPLPDMKSFSGHFGGRAPVPRRASTSALIRPTIPSVPVIPAPVAAVPPVPPTMWFSNVLGGSNDFAPQYSGMSQMPGWPEPPQYWGRTATQHLIRTLALANNNSDVGFSAELERVRRPHIWKVPEWERAVENEAQGAVDHSIWPEDEQAAVLFDAYFANVNNIFPLLHRQLFRRQYSQRLYLGDNAFARVCLMVFANGARFAPTAQTQFTQWNGSTDRFSAGWKYLRAFMTSRSSLRETPSLFTLQAAALVGFFLRGNATPTTIWSIAGAALRSAQELGIHVQMPPPATPAEQQERQMFARAFWCLYHLDRSMCVVLGRAVALPDSEISIKYPLAVDDTYWDDETFLEEPVGVPTDLDAFVQMLALDRIVSTAIQTIPSSAADMNAGGGPRSEKRLSFSATMINLVAALNSWMPALPPHLQWNHDHVESLADESFIRLAHLHARYHWAVLYVHYGGVAAGEWTPELSFEQSHQSAQAIFHICDSLLQHRMYSTTSGPSQRPLPFEFIDYAWLAAAVTLSAMTTGSLPAAKYDAAMAGVNKCIATLLQMECVSRFSGQLADLLSVTARNVAAQVQGQQAYITNNAQVHPTPLSEPSGGTPYSQGLHSIPSVPSASFPTPAPGPAPPLLPPEQQPGLQSPADPYPWLLSSPYGDMHQHHQHQHQQHHQHQQQQQQQQQQHQQQQQQSLYSSTPYSTDAASAVGAGPAAPLGPPPVLSILTNNSSNGYAPTHQTPVSAGASGSAPNISPIEPLPLPIPLPSHEQCSGGGGDERWSHLMSSFATTMQPHHPNRSHPHEHHSQHHTHPQHVQHFHPYASHHPHHPQAHAPRLAHAHPHPHSHAMHAEHRHAQPHNGNATHFPNPNPTPELHPELHLQLQDPNSGGAFTHHP